MPTKRASPKPKPMDGDLTMRQAVAMRMEAALNEPVNWMMGHASFETSGKVFCFVTREGKLAMKLPEIRIAPLLENGSGVLLRMGKRSMREWLVIPESDSPATLKLLREAKAFVESLPVSKRKPAAKKSAAKKASSKKLAAKKRS